MLKNSCWVITDGKLSHIRQATGLAESLNFKWETKSTRLKNYKYYLPFMWLNNTSLEDFEDNDLFCDPYPEWVITAGYRSVPIALLLKRLSANKLRCIHIQDPHHFHRKFDYLVIPDHDQPSYANSISYTGALHDITQKKLDHAKTQFDTKKMKGKLVLGLVIGGNTKKHRMNNNDIVISALNIYNIMKKWKGCCYWITSRRTPPLLKKMLLFLTHYDKTLLNFDEEPDAFVTLLSISEQFMITSDSVSMISECAFTGKPIHLIHLNKFKLKSKILRMLRLFKSKNILKDFKGDFIPWKYSKMDERIELTKKIKGFVI